MNKRRVWLITILILLLMFFAGIFDYPQFLNLKFIPDIPFRLGLDLQGGVHLVYQADLSNIEPEDRSNSLEGLRDVIERRVNLFGVREPLVQVQGERLIVELAGMIDPAEAIRQIGQTPYLEFREQREQQETQKIIAKQEEIKGKTADEIKNIPEWNLAFEDPYFKSTPLTGKYLKKAEVSFEQTTFQPVVALEFNDEGAKIFEELTSRNIGKKLAIYIDQVLISDPVVNEKISGGQAQITGKFTLEQARQLAQNLNAGALPVPIKLISQQSVGPILGKISLERSLRAGVWGFFAIILFMILFYRLPGILASISLLIYIIFVLALFKLIPVTLTLAGIGGFLLSIGFAVDANVLIFSRIKEEMRMGKTFSICLQEGFRRAWPSIRDGNLTTLIVAFILFSFGSSFVKGFALTLILGIIISMISAIIITKNFLKIFEGTRLEKINWLWN